jgi:hypothetical protein
MSAILRIAVVTAACVFLFGIASLEASVRDGTQAMAGPAATGLITGFTGAPLLGAADGTKQDLSLGNTVAVAQELRTGQDDILEILWDRHAVILVRPQSRIMIQESIPGQTVVSLKGGSVRVALAYDSGRPTDMVTVETPSSHVFTRGGILEVDVLPPPSSLFSRVASVFSKNETPIGPALLETVRVVEGQSGIESLTSAPGESHMLEAGVHARIAAGIIEQVGELSQHPAKGVGLTDTDRRQGTPSPLTQRLTNVHITHALEVERQMRTPSRPIDRAEATTGSDLKGTIVSTSLGLPTVLPGQPGTTRGPAPVSQPTPSGPVTPTPPPTVTTPAPTLPPVQAPPIARPVPNQPRGNNGRHLLKDVFDDDNDNKGGGKHQHKGKGDDRDQDYSGSIMTSPLPMLPAVQTSANTTPAPAQPGGINNRDLLKEVSDDDKGGGKHQYKGNDRSQDYSGSILTSPLPTLPAIQIPTITASDHSQAGGMNSHKLLKDLFDDDGGKHKHQGRDRDRDD